jgi:hypothetical protein
MFLSMEPALGFLNPCFLRYDDWRERDPMPIVEYRIYMPIPDPVKAIVVAVDETGNVFTLDGALWFPPEGVKLRREAIISADDFHRAKPSMEPS